MFLKNCRAYRGTIIESTAITKVLTINLSQRIRRDCSHDRSYTKNGFQFLYNESHDDGGNLREVFLTYI